jgi:flagellar biosynthesis/type III secretory pathway protein FliH
MKGLPFLLILFAGIGFFIGYRMNKEEIVYQTKVEYVADPNTVSKSTLESEVANAKKQSYNAGYTEGRKIGLDDGYKSGYTQGTEYGKSLILTEIDLRIQEAERTNTNMPLFRVR